MNPISLRNIPPALARKIRDLARERRISLNKAVICLLEEGEKPKSKGPPYDELDHLAGTWTAEEARTFDAGLAEQRTVDEALWK